MGPLDWLFGGGLGGLIGGPIGQGLTGLFTSAEQDELNDKYDADVQEQIDEMRRLSGLVGPESLAAYDQDSNQQLNVLRGLLGQSQEAGTNFQSLAQQLGRDRYRSASKNLEGYGKQQQDDINRFFDTDLAGTLSGLQDRGIGSTTAMASQRNLNTQNRSAEQRRLGEDLTRMRQDILGGIQGENMGAQLGATQYADALRLGSGANYANFFGQNAVNRSNLVNQGRQTQLNTLGNINYMPPAPNPYPALAGANSVQSVDYGKGNMWKRRGR